LAAGETVNLFYTIQLEDAASGSTETLTVTITGVDHAPVLPASLQVSLNAIPGETGSSIPVSQTITSSFLAFKNFRSSTWGAVPEEKVRHCSKQIT
jgi:hypothetical protein